MDNPLLWTLIAAQVAMGAFDTLYHHEGTERLAWRASQKNELRLHGVRNIFYALIFICFGWFEPHGAFTVALALILGVEVLITLWDFVEEDLTRKLPASERINHTLLALNYGAMLALAAPHLHDWALRDTAIVPTHYGWWSGFASLSALGVLMFGIRDLVAAARSDRLSPPAPEHLVAGLTACKRVLITGGTGFIGTRLVQALVAGRHKVTVLTRDESRAETLAAPICVVTDLDQVPNDERFDIVVNLAGDPVANGVWSPSKRAEIITSRVSVTRQLVGLIARLDEKPECLISGSAVGWYGLHDHEDLTEDAAPKDCFVHQVCAGWEQEAEAARKLGVRVITLRTGLVLGVEGGMLARLLTPFEFGLGGPLGCGRHWMSWIALDDVVRMIAFVVANR
ncbi:MAG: TIGR01777 family oxidoreductase, partial [Pseudomonadota bacterium]